METAYPNVRRLMTESRRANPWAKIKSRQITALLHRQQHTMPLSDDLLEDHRAFRLVRGVPRLPDGKTNQARDRHGDGAMALALAHYASEQPGGPVEFTSAGPRVTTQMGSGFMGDDRGMAAMRGY